MGVALTLLKILALDLKKEERDSFVPPIPYALV
jgi:hypothetical protein